MLTIAVRGIRDNPFRFIATGLAIILGIGFFVGTSVLTTSVNQSLNDGVAQAFSHVDAAVQSTTSIQVGSIKIRPRISPDILPTLRALPDVAAATGFVNGYAQVVGTNGKVLSGGTPSAFNWISEPELNPLTIVAGHAPTAADEVVVDQGSLADAGLHLGEKVRLLPMPASEPFVLVGVMAYKNGSGSGGQRMVALSDAGAQRVFATTEVNQIFVAGHHGIAPSALVASLDHVLPKGQQAETGQQFRKDLEDALGTITNFIRLVLRVFAVVALVVGAFIIYNTFSITVAQRIREMALLRAIGATRRQVTRSIVAESVVVGLVASFLGALFGILLGWLALTLFNAVGIRLGTGVALPAGGLASGVILGTIITVLAAVIPARRAARTPPIAALRDVATEGVGSSRLRSVVGIVLVAGGAVVVGVSIGSGTPVGLLGGGAALLIGVLTLGPVISRPMAMFLGAPAARLRGAVGDLARQNAARNPRRTATTAAALMIGITLVAAATVFASTLRASLREQTSGQIKTELVVSVSSSVVVSGGGMAPDTEAAIAKVPGVTLVSPLRRSVGDLNGNLISITGVRAENVAQAVNPDVTGGSLSALTGADTVAVSDATATANGLRIGSVVGLKLSQRSVDLKVVALYARNQVLGDWTAGTGLFDTTLSGRPLDSLILVGTAPGATSSVQQAVAAILADNPTAEIQTVDQYAAAQGNQVNTLLYVMYGLLGFSVLVALIGIVNTLALSIVERTREIGLLRAVGMTRGQLTAGIRYEAGIVALIGTTLGLGLGIIFGWLASEAARKNFPVFTMPWLGLVIIAVAGLLCGVVAGALPARRAARFNVLAAISTE